MIRTLATKLREAAPALTRDLAGVGGCVLIAVGTGMIYLPAGLIVGGLMLVTIALISGRAAS